MKHLKQSTNWLKVYFPIPLCQPIRNFRSKVLGDYANVGSNATKGQYFYGCKCHALVSESGYVIDYTITPASMTEEVLSQFGTPIVLEDMGYLGQSLHDRLELKGIDLITPVRKNMKQKKILFPNFSKRRKVIERVFSFLTNLGAEHCKSRSSQGFQLKLEMILLAYSLLLKSAKSLEPETLRYSIGYQVMAK